MLFGLPPIHADYTDYTARAAIVEGYNTNVYQDIDLAAGVARRHPSLFTGVDGMVQMRISGRDTDRHDFRLGGRAQHYMAPNQQDDGSVFLAWISKFATSKRTVVNLGAAATLTSLNSSHISDGSLFQVDPTVLRRTYFLTTTDAAVVRELAPTWKLYQRFGLVTSGTLESAPIIVGNTTRQAPPGLDYLQPESETTIEKAFTPRTAGDIRLLIKDTYSAFLIDVTKPDLPPLPPTHFVSALLTAAVTYQLTPRLVNRFAAGGTIATPPPQDPDKKLVLAPAFLDQLYYTRETWYAVLTAQYTYGSVSPRLGTGPGVSAAAVLVGIPYPVGHWRNLGLLGAATAGHSSIVTGVGPASTLDVYGASAQIRYAVSTWLGITAGYDARYALLAGPNLISLPLIRHIVFAGLSGYWSTDPTEPPLTTFQAPVTPPG